MQEEEEEEERGLKLLSCTRERRERETSEDALQGKKDESGTHPPVCLYAGKNIHLFLLMSMSPVAVKCHQLLSLSYFLK